MSLKTIVLDIPLVTAVDVLNSHNNVVGVFLTMASLFIAFYMIHLQKLQWTRFKYDYHYRIRVIICLVLITNRLFHLTLLLLRYQFVALKANRKTLRDSMDRQPAFASDIYPVWARFEYQYQMAYRALDGVTFFIIITMYMFMPLVLGLTLDRYQRVRMVLPTSWEARFLRMTSFFSWLGFLYIISTYMVKYSAEVFPDTVPSYNSNSLALTVINSSKYAEVIVISHNLFMYYIYSIKLILSSIRSQTGLMEVTEKVPMGLFQKFTQMRLFRKKQEASESSMAFELNDAASTLSVMTGDTEVNAGKIEAAIIHQQKIHAVVKMVLLLLAIFMIDAITYVITAAFFAKLIIIPEELAFNLLASLCAWISVHVVLVFLLLDMFLKDLKRANHIELMASTESTHATTFDEFSSNDFRRTFVTNQHKNNASMRPHYSHENQRKRSIKASLSYDPFSAKIQESSMGPLSNGMSSQ